MVELICFCVHHWGRKFFFAIGPLQSFLWYPQSLFWQSWQQYIASWQEAHVNVPRAPHQLEQGDARSWLPSAQFPSFMVDLLGDWLLEETRSDMSNLNRTKVCCCWRTKGKRKGSHHLRTKDKQEMDIVWEQRTSNRNSHLSSNEKTMTEHILKTKLDITESTSVDSWITCSNA